MIQRFFSLAHKAFPILALAVLFPVLTACEPSPDKALSQQAKSGDPAAQYELALAYSDLQQYEKAVHWWKQAAEQGHAPAQVDLGLMHQIGVGTPRNLVEAQRCYLAAAEQGNASGLHNLAYLYRRGNGVERDASQAAAWYLQAAQQGIAHSKSAIHEAHLSHGGATGYRGISGEQFHGSRAS